MVFVKELKKNLMVVPVSGYHFPLPAPDRIQSLLDPELLKSTTKRSVPEILSNSKGLRPMRKSFTKTGKTKLEDAVVSGVGKMDGNLVSLAVMDFRFLGGSMGSVVGEKLPEPSSVVWK